MALGFTCLKCGHGEFTKPTKKRDTPGGRTIIDHVPGVLICSKCGEEFEKAEYVKLDDLQNKQEQARKKAKGELSEAEKSTLGRVGAGAKK